MKCLLHISYMKYFVNRVPERPEPRTITGWEGIPDVPVPGTPSTVQTTNYAGETYQLRTKRTHCLCNLLYQMVQELRVHTQFEKIFQDSRTSRIQHTPVLRTPETLEYTFHHVVIKRFNTPTNAYAKEPCVEDGGRRGCVQRRGACSLLNPESARF